MAIDKARYIDALAFNKADIPAATIQFFALLEGRLDAVEATAGTLGETVHEPVADVAAIRAIPAADRSDGELVVELAAFGLWQFDAQSAAGASGVVLVPDAGSGRWLKKQGDQAAIDTAQAAADAAFVRGKRTLTVLHSDLVDADGSQTLNIQAALPANAYVLAHELRVTTAFTGGGAAVVSCDVGGTDPDAIIDAGNLFTGAIAASEGITAAAARAIGVNPTGMLGGQQLTITVDADVNVADLTAGELTIDILYTIAA
jgi:hypothetical protein